ncbi:MAG: nitroreductase family deazaflavin-dependent oxidoreductase [Anaerolineales bacterium]|nr:nitroreductase family deazaflavin-dependent oxidoreductase [Chloroflexota bacterium]MBL6983239.1 nitroreductase family deazaflavin-dependent oxidoreductase [Anaerolineales bacterium]
MPPALARFFWFLNKFFMVPLFRLGLGPFMGNPFTGYIMVMKVIGRKSGKTYFVPVNYAIKDGNIYCISGGRRTSDWFRNIMANPKVELILPGGAIFASANESSDAHKKLIVSRQILKNAGLAGYFEGYNPRKISEEDLQSKVEDLPLLRFTPQGIGAGASDPAGWAWISVFVITIAFIWAMIEVL